MLVTHALALAFLVVFSIMAVVFRKALWWLLCFFYAFVLGWFAIVNTWEVLLFIPLVFIGIISIIGFIYSALQGEIL